MKFRRPLDDVFGTRARVAVLRALTLGPSGTLSLLAEYARVSHVSAGRATAELESFGIVARRRVGPSKLVELVRDHYLVREIIVPTFLREHAARERIVAVLLKRLSIAKPDSVALFGSVARGEEDWSSDLDILAIGRDVRRLRAAAERTDEELSRRLGGRIHVIAWTPARFAKERRARKTFVGEVLKSYRLLAGRRLEEIG